jgi:hypothetical protein
MPPTNGTRLDSWKAIADYLHVDIRTARRWEKERSLPVYRVPGGGRRAVYADISDIENWLRSGRLPAPAPDAGSPIATIESANATQAGPIPSPNGAGKYRHGVKTRWIFMSAVAGGLGLLLLLALRGRIQETRIDSVSPVYAMKRQTIVIRGHGFGPPPKTVRIDDQGVDTLSGDKQTSLVIINDGRGAHNWTAGRGGETNLCDIGVRLEEWSDTRIVLSGFSGHLGPRCDDEYQLAPSDRLEVQVFGPQNQCGPGGIPNCPDELRKHHIAVFQTEVQPYPTDGSPCVEAPVRSMDK